MKAIIEGKRYNTETATEVADFSNNYPSNDFHYYEESLYQTKAGNWFLQGEGGGLSKYAVPVGNNGSGGGSRIIPLSPAEAKAWLEQAQHLLVAEQYFGAEIQDA